MKYITSILYLLLFTISVQAQQKITLEDIWQKGTFRTNRVAGFNFQDDGRHYTRLQRGEIVQYDLTTGQQTSVLFSGQAVAEKYSDFPGRFSSYSFSDDESRLLLKTASEQIYRRSSKANYFVWDQKEEKLYEVSAQDKQRYATLSPQADKVAFVQGNNLHFKDLASDKTTSITNDGKTNQIINGAVDWVYEEEFSMAKGFSWSPDGSKIAFLRFDESQVKEFTITLYKDGVYPEYETFKYPKVGEDNALVSVHIYDLKTGKTIKVDTPANPDTYYPRWKWTPDSKSLIVFRMNRHQSELELLKVNAQNGQFSTLLKETNEYYIDIHDHLTFIDGGKQFVWMSEQDGYNHIYLYSENGKLLRQLTKGEYDVTNFYGVDEKRKLVYYQAAEGSPLDRQILAIGLDGKKKQMLSPEQGSAYAQFSPTFDYYVITYSNANTAPHYTVYNQKGKKIRVIEDNADMKQVLKDFNYVNKEFFSFKTSENVELNGWMVKPPNFNPKKQYPVLMYVYGGPGSQTVRNSFGSSNDWWFQMLAQKGYVVVSVDNRGTGARGQEFKKLTYLNLGKYETEDQIEAAKYLGSLNYVDASRIGIFGWSYGGYMSSLALFKGNDVFNTAIAVAPVTNWKWYDTIYTERYMRTLKENEKGYNENSPIHFVDRLKGNYLLVHGNADDNVHFQNSVEMANALISANKQFDTYFYPNRNHGIYGDNARMHLYTKMTNFLDEHLQPESETVKRP